MTIPCLTCRAELDDSYKSCPKCGCESSEFAREYSIKPVNSTYELLGRIRDEAGDP
jgi:predicted amidophosphoribosyltransferase